MVTFFSYDCIVIYLFLYQGPSSSGLSKNRPAGPSHPGLPYTTDILLPTGYGGQAAHIPELVTLGPQTRIIADQSTGEIIYDGKVL